MEPCLVSVREEINKKISITVQSSELHGNKCSMNIHKYEYEIKNIPTGTLLTEILDWK